MASWCESLMAERSRKNQKSCGGTGWDGMGWGNGDNWGRGMIIIYMMIDCTRNR